MSGYRKFEEKVHERVGADNEWLHILAGIPVNGRNRFLLLLDHDVDMPTAFDIILVTKEMTDEDFLKKLEDVISEK